MEFKRESLRFVRLSMICAALCFGMVMLPGLVVAEDWLVPESSVNKPAAPAKPGQPASPLPPPASSTTSAATPTSTPTSTPTATPAQPAAQPASSNAAVAATTVSTIGLTRAADLIRLEQPVLGKSATAQPFKAPPGETSRGANGLSVEFKNHRQAGSRWEMEFRFTGGTQGVTLVHPYAEGHCLLTLVNPGMPKPDSAASVTGLTKQDWALVLATRDRWADLGYAGPSNIAWKAEPGFEAAFPLGQKTWHKVQSGIDGKGRWQVSINGQVVATANVTRAVAMSMDVPAGMRPAGTSSWTANKFEGLSGRLAAGQGLVILNPGDVGLDDRGKASLCNIFYGPGQ